MANEKMKQVLLDAYANPTRKMCFYRGFKPTGSERLNSMKRWDWEPMPFRGVPGGSTIMLPLSLGCPSIRTSEGGEWIEPILHSPEDVDRLNVPSIFSGRSGELLRSMKDIVAQPDNGECIVLPDIQSPLQVAELMWDESFYTALVETPDAMHALLRKITPFTIDFILECKRLAGKRLNAASWPGIWSDSVGMMVADDTMSLISPAMHLEFSVPYINQMAQACGPLVYHSCTWRAKYFDNIHAMGPVKSYNWNPGNSDDPAVIIPAFSGKAILAPHLVLNMHKDNDVLAWGKNFADEAEFFEYHLDCMQENTTLYWYFSNIVEKGAVMEKIYDILDRRGYTPEACGVV